MAQQSISHKHNSIFRWRCLSFSFFPGRDLLKQFTTMELMRWSSVVEDYGKELREGSMGTPDTDVFTYSEEGEKRWKDLKNRVVEHVSEAYFADMGGQVLLH